MKKILAVAKWEYIEKVKTKAFIISLIITPIIIISFSILPSILFNEEPPNVEVIGMIDTSEVYFNEVEYELSQYKLPDGNRNYVLINLSLNSKNFEELKSIANKKIQKNLIEGYLILYNPESDSVYAEYRSKLIGNFKIVGRLEEALSSIQTKEETCE